MGLLGKVRKGGENMQLSAKLRMLRKGRYTLMDVSNETGLSVSFLSDVERGRTKPSLHTLEKLAEFYQMTVNDLLDEVDFGTSDPSYPLSFAEFLKETDVDEDLVDLILKVEQRARDRAKTPEDWREYYYSLKRILGR
jgi:transcriptional regulator with XRE-family HTH domain